MHLVIATERISVKIFCTTIGIASFLQWLVYGLLKHANLGSTAECFSLAQAFVVLLVAPCLAATNMISDRATPSGHSFLLNLIFTAKPLLTRLFIRLIPILCWICLSSGLALLVTEVSIGKVLAMIVVLTLYSFSVGAVGMWCTRVLKDVFFGTELAYFILSVLLGSAFILKPLARYIDNVQPMVQPILHLNPLIAVCNIFDGWDIFRNPLFYELTPITYYVYSYPPWYVSCFWQLVIGVCCFLWTWSLYRSSDFVVVD